jgi:RNA polymerase sigma-70 factor (ECF subfamily)
MNSRLERDEWLMAQVALGKRDHLEPLIRRYANPLLTFIRRMVGDRHRGEDIFQEVFLTVWAKRKQYQFPRPFKSWLFAIAANQCHAQARRRAFMEVWLPDPHDLPSPADEKGSPADTAIATETAALVAAAVQELPAQQRAVVAMRIWNGLSYPEIAEALGRTEATIRSHMHHGLLAMRRYLEPRMNA